MAIRHSFPSLVVALLVMGLSPCSEAVEFVTIECEESVVEASRCGAGGVFNGDGTLSGTFVCGKRNFGLPGFAWQKPVTTCAPTVLGQVIGYEGDQCGCCGVECPKPCSCVCDEAGEKVIVVKKGLLFGVETPECVSRGRASRMVGDGTSAEYSCATEDTCASYVAKLEGEEAPPPAAPAAPAVEEEPVYTPPAETVPEAPATRVPESRADPGE